jgi:peptidoglycan-associated lipoprotein
MAGLLTLSAIALVGCARVKPEEMAAELTRLREEMRTEITQGDQKVATDLGTRVDGVEARLNTVATELSQLNQEFDVAVERFEGAIRFSAPVYFDFAQAEVRPGDMAVLDKFAEIIATHYPEVVVTAEGFTDPAGSRAYNEALGKKRAEAVTTYLAGKGMDAARLRAVSYGENTDRLLDEERGPGDRGQANRRVILVIEGPQPTVTTTTQTN